MVLQSNLVNFEILETGDFISNYREVDIKIYNPKKWLSSAFSVKYKFWARKRNVLMRRFFYAPETYVIIDSY